MQHEKHTFQSSHLRVFSICSALGWKITVCALAAVALSCTALGALYKPLAPAGLKKDQNGKSPPKLATCKLVGIVDGNRSNLSYSLYRSAQLCYPPLLWLVEPFTKISHRLNALTCSHVVSLFQLQFLLEFYYSRGLVPDREVS